MKRNIYKIIGLLFIVIMFSGCATILGRSTHPLVVSSRPDGADVYVNGFKMGTTPIQLDLKADKSYTIEYKKEGFETVTRIVNTKVGAGWVILDVISGLVPVIVDAITGEWSRLDQKTVNAYLEKQK